MTANERYRKKSSFLKTSYYVNKHCNRNNFVQHTLYEVIRNTTRRIKHAAKLKQSEKKFRALTENSSDHILRVSKNGNIIFCNPAFLSDLDLRDEEILGKKVNDVQGIPPGLKVGLNKAYNHVVITEELASMDFEYMKGDAKVAFDFV